MNIPVWIALIILISIFFLFLSTQVQKSFSEDPKQSRRAPRNAEEAVIQAFEDGEDCKDIFKNLIAKGYDKKEILKTVLNEAENETTGYIIECALKVGMNEDEIAETVSKEKISIAELEDELYDADIAAKKRISILYKTMMLEK